jgi:hypothetical protein
MWAYKYYSNSSSVDSTFSATLLLVILFGLGFPANSVNISPTSVLFPLSANDLHFNNISAFNSSIDNLFCCFFIFFSFSSAIFFASSSSLRAILAFASSFAFSNSFLLALTSPPVDHLYIISPSFSVSTSFLFSNKCVLSLTDVNKCVSCSTVTATVNKNSKSSLCVYPIPTFLGTCFPFCSSPLP